MRRFITTWLLLPALFTWAAIAAAASGTPNPPASAIYYKSTVAGAAARSVASKLGDVVSVKDCGAKGDGTTNDTTAIQACIDGVALVYGTVYFPRGTYLVTSLQMLDTSQVSLLGEGPGASIIQSTSAANPILDIRGTTVTPREFNSVIQGLQIKAASASPVVVLRIKQAARITLRDVWLEGHASTTTNAQLVNVVDVLLDRVRVRSAAQIGIDIFYDNAFGAGSRPTTVTLRKAVVTSVSVWGLRATEAARVTVDDSIFESNGDTNDTNHGGIYCFNMDPAGVGIGCSVRDTWLENQTGVDIHFGDNASSVTANLVRDVISVSGTRGYGLYVPTPGGGRAQTVYVSGLRAQNATTADISIGNSVNGGVKDWRASTANFGTGLEQVEAAIIAGRFDNVTIGGITPKAGTFTTVEAPAHTVGGWKGLHYSGNALRLGKEDAAGQWDSFEIYIAGTKRIHVGTAGVELTGSTTITTAAFLNGAEPACNSTNRGALVMVQGGVGVADTFRICTKDGADAYAYRALF